MGKKRESGAARPHPTKSFDQYVADATLQKFGGYIDAQVNNMGQVIVQHINQVVKDLKMRLVVLEEVLLEQHPNVTKDDLVSRVVSLEDKTEGFEVVDGKIEAGDRVRIELSSKKTEDVNFSAPSRLMVNAVGTGHTLGKELEESLIGLLTGETREVVMGPDGGSTIKMLVNKVSRRPKPAKPQTGGQDAADAG